MARLEREQAQALAVKRQDILAELGLAGGAPTVIEDLVSRYVATMAFVEHLEHRLAAVGVTSSKGRPRAALQGYLQLLDRARRLADDLAGAVQPPSTVEARRLSREARRV